MSVSLRFLAPAPFLDLLEEIANRIVIELSVSGIFIQPVFQVLF